MLTGLRVRPLYLAAAISGIAAAFWHAAASKGSGAVDDAGDAKRAGFESASDYDRASEMVNRASIDVLDSNDEADVHRWLADPKKQQFVLMAVCNLHGPALMDRFKPDLAAVAQRPGMASSIETVFEYRWIEIAPS